MCTPWDSDTRPRAQEERHHREKKRPSLRQVCGRLWRPYRWLERVSVRMGFSVRDHFNQASITEPLNSCNINLPVTQLATFSISTRHQRENPSKKISSGKGLHDKWRSTLSGPTQRQNRALDVIRVYWPHKNASEQDRSITQDQIKVNYLGSWAPSLDFYTVLQWFPNPFSKSDLQSCTPTPTFNM